MAKNQVRTKDIVSRRVAEIAEKGRIFRFNTKMVVVFPSVYSVSLAKRAREKFFVSRKAAKGAKLKKIKMLPVPSSPLSVSCSRFHFQGLAFKPATGNFFEPPQAQRSSRPKAAPQVRPKAERSSCGAPGSLLPTFSFVHLHLATGNRQRGK